MKKNILSISIACLCLMCLCACEKDDRIQGEEYILKSVALNGVEIDGGDGSLVLGQYGRGLLSLGEDSCQISYDDSSLTVNSISAPAVFSDGSVVVTMGDTGLVYTFMSAGGSSGSDAEAEQAEDTGELCSGRLYFSTCTGDWAEYDGNSIAVEGEISFDESGTGELKLYAPAYSDSVPVFRSAVTSSDGELAIADAVAFQYMLQDGSVTAAKGTMPGSQLNNTEFIDPHEYDWYVEPDEASEPDPEVEFISIEGDCRDDSGSFIFRILIKQD